MRPKLSDIPAIIIGLVLGLGIICAMSGCSTTESDRMAGQAAGGYEGIIYAKRHREDYIASRPIPSRIEEAIRAGRITPGMTQDDVRVGLGYTPNHTAQIGGNTVWFWRAGKHRINFHFDGTTGLLTRTSR